LNDQRLTEEIKREIKNFLESNENENATYQNLSYSAGNSKRKLYSYQYLNYKIGEISNK
jgi:effector-binding domain-containing protein